MSFPLNGESIVAVGQLYVRDMFGHRGGNGVGNDVMGLSILKPRFQ